MRYIISQSIYILWVNIIPRRDPRLHRTSLMNNLVWKIKPFSQSLLEDARLEEIQDL